ncbi:hypothetical protein NFI96_011353, partial [Prochilodus magdalenae]
AGMIRAGQEEFFIEPLERGGGDMTGEEEGGAGRHHILYRSSDIKKPALSHVDDFPPRDSENLEESLCSRNRADGQNWMPVIFRPSDSTALKQVRDGVHDQRQTLVIVKVLVMPGDELEKHGQETHGGDDAQVRDGVHDQCQTLVIVKVLVMPGDELEKLGQETHGGVIR